ncbi:MAG: H4MPT-linked C1 transfer pathway protein [Methylotenera sp. RIFCSPLOWO2_02_FULL_45_14]|nr:MAG: H4MPT-linked C1 transfer pathway protein [Methylotenera sp. RIFCSPLOWO2_02_FULL_45_14]
MSQNQSTQTVIGWDIGGAHLKAVMLNVAGHVLAVNQVYCPLWRGLHELDLAMDVILREFNAEKHVVTMTGELADIFPNRHAGVMQIAQFAAQKLSGQKLLSTVMFYAGNQGVVTIETVEPHSAEIASMNWLASVQYIAHNVKQALFIDMGSTTTDIALISDGKVQVRGFNDATRMQCDELVYTGVVRTPLMALTQKIPFAGQQVNIAAEHFATTADVYTLTGDLALAENMAETADGAEKSIEASARRVARMIGHDAQEAPLSAWRNLAYAFKQAQLNLIKQAVLTQISRLGDCQNLHIIGAGAGEFMVGELAKQLGFKYASVSDFIYAESDAKKNMVKVCFPAYAVASLGLNV